MGVIWLTGHDHHPLLKPLISFTNRYYAVTHPIKYSKHKSNKRVALTIAMVWIISAAIGSPIVFGLNTSPERIPELCIFYNSDFIIYSSLSSFYIPCLAMIYLYYRIFKAIHERAKQKSEARKQAPIAPSASQRAPAPPTAGGTTTSSQQGGSLTGPHGAGPGGGTAGGAQAASGAIVIENKAAVGAAGQKAGGKPGAKTTGKLPQITEGEPATNTGSGGSQFDEEDDDDDEIDSAEEPTRFHGEQNEMIECKVISNKQAVLDSTTTTANRHEIVVNIDTPDQIQDRPTRGEYNQSIIDY